MAETTAILNVTDLSVRLGGVTIVEEVTFSLGSGDLALLIGVPPEEVVQGVAAR